MQVEKTVFISYRRSNYYTALNVFQNLKARGFDVFFDFESIDSGAFEQTILNQIRARAHFLVILHADTLIRTKEPGDWVRREIETGIDEKRNVVPITFDDFDWKDADTSLTGKLGLLKEYNALDVPRGYFDEAMDRLESRYLNKPLDLVIQPTPPAERAAVLQSIRIAETTSRVTENQMMAEGYLVSSNIKFELGDYEGAVADCQRAISLVPEYAGAHNNYGVMLYSMGNIDDSIYYYSQAIYHDSSFALAFYNRAVARSRKGDRDGAIGDYTEAIRLNMDYSNAYFNRGVVYYAKGDYGLAIDDFSQVILLAPSNADAYVNRGVALSALGDYSHALDDYSKAIRLKPNFSGAFYNRYLVRHAQGDVVNANADLVEAKRLGFPV